MPHICRIYVLLNDDESVFYVGRTSRDPRRRMAEHKQTLGFTPRYKIIARCSKRCRDVERKWIEHYRGAGHQLRNISYGQGPHFLPESSREKLRSAFTGRPVTWGDKISSTQRGRKKEWSRAGRARVQSSQFKVGESAWNKLSPEQQEKIRKAARDQWNDPERRARMLSGLNRKGGIPGRKWKAAA